MRGLAQPVVGVGTPAQQSNAPTPSNIYGLVVQRSYPDQQAVRALLSASEALWVCAETDLEARRLLADREHVELPLLPFFKGETYDVRRTWRDAELVNLCDRVYVFQKADAKNIWTEWKRRGVHDGLTIVNPPKRGRNPRPSLTISQAV